MAIATSFCTEIWRNKLLTIRGVITGWTSLWVLTILFRFAPPVNDAVWNLLAFANPAIWSRLRWGYLGWLVLFIVFGGSGLIVAYLHRTHQTVAVLAFALSWWLMYLPWLCQLAVDARSDSRYLNSLVNMLTLMILVPVSILVGGLWRSNRNGDLSSPQSKAQTT